MVDLRIYYGAEENKKDWKPSTKGLLMSRKMISKLKEGIDIERSHIEELEIIED